MEMITVSPKSDLHSNFGTSIEGFNSLMAAMGLNKFSGVSVPEQEYILYVLKEHGAEGLLTRELADKCEMSIYKIRHLLLPLEESGQITRIKYGKHHRWYFYNKNML